MVSLLATIHNVPLCGRLDVNKCLLMSQNLCCFCRLQQGFEALFIMSRRTGRLAQACCCQPGCTCAELITVSFSADNIFNQEHRCCHFSAQTGVSVPDMHDETPVTGSRRPSGCTESPQVRKGGRENEKELRHLLSPSFPATAESTAHRGTGCLLPRQNKKQKTHQPGRLSSFPFETKQVASETRPFT